MGLWVSVVLPRGRVSTACCPSAPWGLTSFGILNVSDPVGALCLSRAPPAGRGEASPRPPNHNKGAAKPRPYLPPSQPYSSQPVPSVGLSVLCTLVPPSHLSTFAPASGRFAPLHGLQPSSVLCTPSPRELCSRSPLHRPSTDLHLCTLQLALSPFLAVLSLAPSFNPTAPA